MAYSETQKKKYHTFLQYHLNDNERQLPASQQVALLQGKKRRFNFVMLLNVLAILFFGYWFVAGITQLPDMVFYILVGIFALNTLAVLYQRKQLNEVVDFLNTQEVDDHREH